MAIEYTEKYQLAVVPEEDTDTTFKDWRVKLDAPTDSNMTKIEAALIEASKPDTYVAQCTTNGNDPAKIVDCPDFKLEKGARIIVDFMNTDVSSEPTLNVNSTGAHKIRYSFHHGVEQNSYISKNMIQDMTYWEFTYNGNCYIGQPYDGSAPGTLANPVVVSEDELAKTWQPGWYICTSNWDNKALGATGYVQVLNTKDEDGYLAVIQVAIINEDASSPTYTIQLVRQLSAPDNEEADITDFKTLVKKYHFTEWDYFMVGSNVIHGHVKLSDLANKEYGQHDGVAVTPLALHDHIEEKANDCTWGHVELKDSSDQDLTMDDGYALSPLSLYNHEQVFGKQEIPGHVKLSDLPNKTLDVNQKTAVTPKALQDAIDSLYATNGDMNDITGGYGACGNGVLTLTINAADIDTLPTPIKTTLNKNYAPFHGTLITKGADRLQDYSGSYQTGYQELILISETSFEETDDYDLGKRYTRFILHYGTDGDNPRVYCTSWELEGNGTGSVEREISDVQSTAESAYKSQTRAATVVVGTLKSGHTITDCDYLCDGTDDFKEINEAIASLKSKGGKVLLLDGTYNMSGGWGSNDSPTHKDRTIVIDSPNIILEGMGMGATTIHTSDHPVYVSPGGSNCTIQNLTIDGLTGNSSYAIDIRDKGATIQNVNIENCYHGIGLATYDTEDARSALISNCVINLAGSNVVTSCAVCVGPDAPYCLVQGCRIKMNNVHKSSAAIQVGASSTSITGSQIDITAEEGSMPGVRGYGGTIYYCLICNNIIVGYIDQSSITQSTIANNVIQE